MTVGACHAPETFLVARIAPHMWEEPPISGNHGSGTVFFGGCNLGCVFCQNRTIRDGELGEQMDAETLLARVESLMESGVHNLNLVTPTHYTRALVPFLEAFRARYSLPVVWNSGGYESVDSLRMLDGLVDVYLPDLKYYSPALAAEYSSAPDYFSVAAEALCEMLRQTGAPRFDDAGLLVRGTVVRHLVLPACREDSMALLSALADRHGSQAFLLSLMSQYTPEFAKNAPYKNLHRRITSFEYEAVLAHARRLGFDGYFQSRASATKSYTPDFTNGELLELI